MAGKGAKKIRHPWKLQIAPSVHVSQKRRRREDFTFPFSTTLLSPGGWFFEKKESNNNSSYPKSRPRKSWQIRPAHVRCDPLFVFGNSEIRLFESVKASVVDSKTPSRFKIWNNRVFTCGRRPADLLETLVVVVGVGEELSRGGGSAFLNHSGRWTTIYFLPFRRGEGGGHIPF